MSNNTLIDRAATYVRRPSEATAAELWHRKEAAAKATRTLFACEDAAATDLSQQQAAVASEILAKDTGYPVFDLAPLRWRDWRGLPKLMPFALDSATATIDLMKDDRMRAPTTFTNLPKSVRHCYADVERSLVLKNVRSDSRKLAGVCNFIPAIAVAIAAYLCRNSFIVNAAVGIAIVVGGVAAVWFVLGCLCESKYFLFCKSYRHSVVARFGGVIPADVREKIVAAKRQFDDVFLVAETPDLRVTCIEWPDAAVRQPLAAVARSREGDPLVIGYKAHATGGGTHYLIAAVDTTTLEQYVAYSAKEGVKA